jgi:MFS family permease
VRAWPTGGAQLKSIVYLLRGERDPRRFLAGYALYSLGTGAGYVALLLVGYARFRSPWAISLVLLADFVPAMLAGPLFGALADRWPKRLCSVGSLLASAGAFAGIAVVHSFVATVLLALLAGAATGLYLPTALAALPTLVEREILGAATSLFGAIRNAGQLVGPGIAAVALTFTTPDVLVGVIGGVFVLAAAATWTVRFAEPERAPDSRVGTALLVEMREGLSTTMRAPALRTIVLATAGALLFMGMLNVAELLLAKRVLHAGSVGFSVLVAVFGVGILAGSLAGSRRGGLQEYKRRYLGGIIGFGLALAVAGAAPNLPVAALAFAVCGFSNGMFLVHQRLLIQIAVPNRLLGRVFGVVDTATAWGFAIAFVTAGGLIEVLGVRGLLELAAGGTVAVGLLATVALSRAWPPDSVPSVGTEAPVSQEAV